MKQQLKQHFCQNVHNVKEHIGNICTYGFEKKTVLYKLIFSFLFALIIFIILVSFYPAKAEATDIHKPVRRVTSICINAGESLWSIASEYYTDGEGSMNDYIEEIKKTNHLKSDRIHAGNYLVIPYYDIEI